jgi:predicted nucleotidyltransferase
MTSTLPTLHAAFLDRVRGAAKDDARVDAVLAGGSYVHGGMDAHSDLDLVIVAREEAYDDLMRSRRTFAEGLGTLLAAFTGEHVGEPRLLICLYGPPLLHVDLKFVDPAGLARLVERPAILFARDHSAIDTLLDGAAIAWPDMDPQWFEDRAWIWLHYAATKLARGELFEAIAMLAFFREQVLGPMLHRRAGRPQRGVRRIEQAGLDADGRLAATLSKHDRGALQAAIHAAVDLYLDLRTDDPPPRPTAAMPDALRAFMTAK